jgi:hypothetical protein
MEHGLLMTCPTCQSPVRVEGRTTQYYVPEHSPEVMELIRAACAMPKLCPHGCEMSDDSCEYNRLREALKPFLPKEKPHA